MSASLLQAALLACAIVLAIGCAGAALFFGTDALERRITERTAPRDTDRSARKRLR